MLDYSTIQNEAEKAARRARRAGKRPLSIREFSPDRTREFCARIPFLGAYIPEGWERAEGIEDLFVDSSGFGAENEPALSLGQFAKRLESFRQSGDNYGFGIFEAGEFQVYVRVYRPDSRDFTHSGALREDELARIRDN